MKIPNLSSVALVEVDPGDKALVCHAVGHGAILVQDGRLKVLQRLGVLDGHAQQRLSRAGWVAAALFPVLIGAHRHAEQGRKRALRHADLGTGDRRLGRLNARDARRVEDALASDPELARQYAVIREEYAETIGLNESLGAPSARAMQKLFAAIDAEPERKPSAGARVSAGISEFFSKLSPRTLAWSSSLGAVVVLLQAGVIGAVLMRSQPASFQTASLDAVEQRSAPSAPSAVVAPSNPAPSAPITRDLGASVAATPTRLLVRFTPDARIADISALLDNYQGSIVDGKGGMFRLQFRAMDKDSVAALIARLQKEKIVSLAVETP